MSTHEVKRASGESRPQKEGNFPRNLPVAKRGAEGVLAKIAAVVPAQAPDGTPASFEIHVEEAAGGPRACTYLVKLPGGSMKKGRTDERGHARFPAPPGDIEIRLAEDEAGA